MTKYIICLLLFLATSLSYGQIICIDAGHGGSDPGAVGNGLQEKNINLDVAKRLARLLSNDGYDARLVRSNDSAVSLSGRTSYANRIGAKYFISIHCNAFNKSARGTETFAYTQGSSKSFGLRNSVHPEIVRAMSTVDRGVKTANFYVIKHTNMPAILCELAFIDYPKDAAKLGDSFYRDKCAQAIRRGLNKTMDIAEEGLANYYMAPRWSENGDSLIVTTSRQENHYRMSFSGEVSPSFQANTQSIRCEEGKVALEGITISLENDIIYHAEVSPNGEKIVLESLEQGILVCDKFGQNIQAIAKGNNPCWSADSQSLVFDQTIDNGHDLVASNLIMVKLENPKELIYLLKTEGLFQKNEKTHSHENSIKLLPQRPSLSPGGKKIAFDMEGKIYIAELNENQLENFQLIK